MFGTLKIMANIGKNTCNDYALPVTRTVENKKEYEIRVYEKNKYIQISYRTIDKSEACQKPAKNETKQGNEQVMERVWKLMKYTQGENEKNLNMKLVMPVFVFATTLDSKLLAEEEFKALKEGEKYVEISIRVSLPEQFQTTDPPAPNDKDLTFVTIDSFKSYVGYYKKYFYCLFKIIIKFVQI